MDQGLMSTLEGLVNNGVIGPNLATLDPPLSPILWTSIATSKPRDKHGILGFVEPDPEKNEHSSLMFGSSHAK
jgi:predicted AlkP superfamily phosphohydrolase/phosphomutase